MLILSSLCTNAQEHKYKYYLESHLNVFADNLKTEFVAINPSYSTYITTKDGFEVPQFSVNFRIERQILKQVFLGLETGVAMLISDYSEVKYLHAKKLNLLSLNNLVFTYKLSNEKTAFQPFTSLKLGYVFMNRNLYSGSTQLKMTGGYSYSLLFGFKIKNNKQKFLDRSSFTLGYNSFFTHTKMLDNFTPNYSQTIHFDTQRESFTLGLLYQLGVQKKKTVRYY